MPDVTITLTDAENAALAAIATHASVLAGTTTAIVARAAVRRLLDEFRQAPATDGGMPLSELQSGRASRATIAKRESQVGK